jgi:hypothetical protein
VVEEQNGSAESIKDHVWGLGYVDDAVQTRVNTNPTGTASWSSYFHLQDEGNRIWMMVHAARFAPANLRFEGVVGSVVACWWSRERCEIA